MAAITRRRGLRTAAAFSVAVFVLTFAYLYDAPVFVPHQGVQSVLAAESLMAGRGFAVSADTPFAKFGPFYPLLLASLGRLGVEATAAIYLVNCASFALTLFGLFLLGRALEIRPTGFMVAAFCVWAPNHYLIRAARPDPIVVALSLIAIVAMIAYVRRPAIAPLLGAACCCAAAAATRYMALLTLVPLFVLALALARGVSLRRRLADLALYGFVAVTPVALWMIRNQQVTGFLSGRSRTDSRDFMAHYGLFGNLYGMLKTIVVDAFGIGAIGIRWVVYGKEPLPHPPLVAAFAIVTIATLVALAWAARADLLRYAAEHLGSRTECGSALLLTKSYVSLYVVVLIAVWTLSNNDPIETRYLAPIYPFTFLSVFGLLGIAARSVARGWIVAATLAVVLLSGVPNVVKSTHLLVDSPPGRTYVPVTVVGPRGTNWVEPLDWVDVGPSADPASP